MQNAHYATELLHLLSTGLGGGGGVVVRVGAWHMVLEKLYN